MKIVVKLIIIASVFTSYASATSEYDKTCIAYTDSLKNQSKRTIDSISSMRNLARSEVYEGTYMTIVKSLLKSKCAIVIAREKSVSVQSVTDEYLRHLKIAQYAENDIALWKKPCLSTAITSIDNMFEVAVRIPDDIKLSDDQIKKMRNILSIEQEVARQLDVNECTRESSKLIVWVTDGVQLQKLLNDSINLLLKSISINEQLSTR